MSRYIKVDDYKDIESDYLIHGEYGQETRYMQMMDDVIANKSIDIVRCKACRYWSGSTKYEWGDCDYFRKRLKHSGGCTFGEPQIDWVKEIFDDEQTEPSIKEFVQGMKNLKAEVKGSERSVKGSDPLHDDCFDCDKFFTCDNKGEDYKTDCPWK